GKMENPYEANVVDGAPHGQEGDCLWGRGNCEHRGALAAALAAFNTLCESDAGLSRSLVFLVLTTGESGHHGVIDQALKENSLPIGPALIARGTGNRPCLGNKGSLHARIEIHGRSYHPSNPAKALNAIDGAEEALRRLRAYASANPVRDKDLGDSVLVPIDIASQPKGPIIPDECTIEVSGRLVPGQDPERLISGLRDALHSLTGFRTEVILERYHYPAKVAPDHPLAAAAEEAVGEVGGITEALYMHASLDAGYFCHHGQAAISLGPGAPELAHSPSDMVSLKELEEGARIYLSLFRRFLSG
ncbi:MAG: M20/M25/M40 family metallo-hydrolase, partial [bacterium]